MLIKGTKRENVEIDISNYELVNTCIKYLTSKFDSDRDYVDLETNTYHKFEDINYHNGEWEYTTRPATENEIKIQKCIELIDELMN